jgi:hypothetical protein
MIIRQLKLKCVRANCLEISELLFVPNAVLSHFSLLGEFSNSKCASQKQS